MIHPHSALIRLGAAALGPIFQPLLLVAHTTLQVGSFIGTLFSGHPHFLWWVERLLQLEEISNPPPVSSSTSVGVSWIKGFCDGLVCSSHAAW